MACRETYWRLLVRTISLPESEMILSRHIGCARTNRERFRHTVKSAWAYRLCPGNRGRAERQDFLV